MTEKDKIQAQAMLNAAIAQRDAAMNHCIQLSAERDMVQHDLNEALLKLKANEIPPAA